MIVPTNTRILPQSIDQQCTVAAPVAIITYYAQKQILSAYMCV